MKKVLLPVAMACLLLLVSCRNSEAYEFLNPTHEIAEITIVNILFGENCDLIEAEIKKIEDTSTFLKDFQKVNCYTYFGDPIGVTPEGVEDTVIKISYANGEYELINWNGQSKYTAEKGFNYYAGYSTFDEQQFESLMAKNLLE